MLFIVYNIVGGNASDDVKIITVFKYAAGPINSAQYSAGNNRAFEDVCGGNTNFQQCIWASGDRKKESSTEKLPRSPNVT